MRSPAPISSTNASATSVITNAVRSRCWLEVPVDRPPLFNMSFSSERATCSPGARPKTIPVTMDAATVKSSTGALIAISHDRGSHSLVIDFANSSPHAAIRTPTSAPAIDRTMLSVNSWRSSRPDPAPRADRTANSLARLVARASSRLATLEHAISSTNSTAPISRKSAGRGSPTTSSWSENRLTTQFVFVSTYCLWRRTAIVSICACAAAMVTPGFRRPITERK